MQLYTCTAWRDIERCKIPKDVSFWSNISSSLFSSSDVVSVDAGACPNGARNEKESLIGGNLFGECSSVLFWQI
jgi:hypothetical protein